MCGRRLRAGLVIYLALLLLWPCSCWGDVVLTDEEATALRTSLTTAKKELTEQQKQIEQLRKQLTEAESELTTASEQLERSRTETEALRNNLTKLSGSWKEQQREARKAKTKALFIGLGIGAVGGFCGGWYLAKYK